MNELRVYHNPRCSKSRQALQYLDAKALNYEVRKYLDEPLTRLEIKTLLKKIGISADALLRKGEKFYKENLKGKEWSEDEIIDFMIKEPKLIERPIIELGENAVIGRPTEAIDKLL